MRSHRNNRYDFQYFLEKVSRLSFLFAPENMQKILLACLASAFSDADQLPAITFVNF